MTKERRTQLNGMLLSRIESLCRHLYPNGAKKGRSWRCGSMDIRLRDGMWGDWDGTTGERMTTSLIDLWLYARDVNFVTGIAEITAWLGIPESELPAAEHSYKVTKSDDGKRRICFPLLERPTHAELVQLSELRSIPVVALLIAVTRGYLWTYTDRFEKCRAWLVTDSSRNCGVARRLDGKRWEAEWVQGAKSKTISGSWGHWPLGIAEASLYPAIGLTEGVPDFLAMIALGLAYGVERYIAPVCMAGAHMTIPESVLPLFANRRTRIFVHNDEEGKRAAVRWATQLAEVTYVDAYLCDAACEDLNDVCRTENTEDAALMDFVKGEQ